MKKLRERFIPKFFSIDKILIMMSLLVYTFYVGMLKCASVAISLTCQIEERFCESGVHLQDSFHKESCLLPLVCIRPNMKNLIGQEHSITRLKHGKLTY